MAHRQVGKLHPPIAENAVAGDEEGVGPFAREGGEDRIDLVAGAGLDDLNFQPDGASGRLHLSQRGLGIGIGRIKERGHTNGTGHQLTQEFQPLCRQLDTEKIDPCRGCHPAGRGWRQDRA